MLWRSVALHSRLGRAFGADGVCKETMAADPLLPEKAAGGPPFQHLLSQVVLVCVHHAAHLIDERLRL